MTIVNDKLFKSAQGSLKISEPCSDRQKINCERCIILSKMYFILNNRVIELTISPLLPLLQ